MNSMRLLLPLSCLLVAGCASTKMAVAPEQTLSPVNPDQARVVFLRSSFVGSAIQAALFDVSEVDPKFIGIISDGTKLAYDTEAGHRIFMVVSEAADFMEADLQAGRTYYGMVTPRMGAWKARFSLWPVRNGPSGEYDLNSEKFQGWLEKNSLVVNTRESEQWFIDNLESIREKQTEYWAAWQEKSPQDLAERTLNPDDGV
jgi:hypothetical protein